MNTRLPAIVVPQEVIDAVDELAETMQVTRSEIYRRALREYLKAHGKEVRMEVGTWGGKRTRAGRKANK